MPEWEVSNYWTRIRNLKRWYWAFDRIIDFRRKYLLILITNRNVNLGVLIRMAAKDETATTFVDKEEKLKDLKYIAQGNNDYYSEENMFKRFVLMKSKAIRRAVDLWWNVAYQPKIETVPKKQILHKWQYVDMNIRMQLALVPDLPGAEALECAEEDWKDDAHGKHSMGRESFFHALFQLADLWVDSVHEQDYVRFLLNLLISVAKSPPWPPTTWCVVVGRERHSCLRQQRRMQWRQWLQRRSALCSLPCALGQQRRCDGRGRSAPACLCSVPLSLALSFTIPPSPRSLLRPSSVRSLIRIPCL